MSSNLTFGRLGRVWPFLIALLTAGSLAACATEQQKVSQKEDSLAAAGFTVRPADTPERQAMINRLPPHHFVQRNHGDTVTYVYADPLDCDCLYVGSQQAYAKFRQHAQEQKLADEKEMTAQDYSDSAWNWDSWELAAEPGFGAGFGGDAGRGFR